MAAEENDESLLPEMDELLAKCRSELEHLELGMLLSGEYDANNAILTLHAGAGGTEAQDWTSMLLRMFTRFAEQNGFALEMLDYQPGDEAGVKVLPFRLTATMLMASCALKRVYTVWCAFLRLMPMPAVIPPLLR